VVTTCDRKIYVETPGAACLCGRTGVAEMTARAVHELLGVYGGGVVGAGGLTPTRGQAVGAHCGPHRQTTGPLMAFGCLRPSVPPASDAASARGSASQRRPGPTSPRMLRPASCWPNCPSTQRCPCPGGDHAAFFLRDHGHYAHCHPVGVGHIRRDELHASPLQAQ
jgi:hypothetical protein